MEGGRGATIGSGPWRTIPTVLEIAPAVSASSALQARPAGRWAPRLLLLVLLAAALVRLWDLGGGPDPLDVDEGYTGVDTLRLLAGGLTPYFAANNGAEPLYVYLAAPSVALLGPTPLALRLPAALAGTASVLATYLLVRALFISGGGRRETPAAPWLALGAALLQTISLWHLHLSRDGSRVVLLPLLLTLGLWLLWCGLRGAGRWTAPSFAGAGACLALTAYTYLPARLVPLLVLVLVGHLGWSRRAWLRTRGWGVLLAGLVATVVLLPLAVYYAAHWQALVFRMEMVSLTNPAVHGGDPWSLLAHNVAGTLGMFAGEGDRDPQYNVAARPVFPLPLALLAALGLLVALRRARQPAYALLVVWLTLMLLPGVLSANAPHFARQVGILPAVYVFPVLGGWWLAARLGGGRGRVRPALVALAAAGVVGHAAAGALDDYFDRPPAEGPHLAARLAALPARTVYVAGSEETALIGGYLTALGARPAAPALRFTQGFHSLLLPAQPADALYLVEEAWWAGQARALLAAEYQLVPAPLPAGLERFRAYRLAARAEPEAWAPLPPVHWALGVHLLGYRLPAAARPGEEVRLALHWRVVNPAPDDPGQDYTFATALLDGADVEVANRDWLGHPRPFWREGDEVVSVFALCLPATLPEGTLRAAVALYSRADFVRRPPLDAAGQALGHRVVFGALAVSGPPQQPPCTASLYPG